MNETVKLIIGLSLVISILLAMVVTIINYGLEREAQYEKNRKAVLQSIVTPVDETSYAGEGDFPVLHPGYLEGVGE